MIEHLAIVGATGAVGREVCAILDGRGIKPRRITLLASSRSVGKRIAVGGTELEVAELTERSFDGVDFAIFSAGGGGSRQFAPAAVRAGAVVIDNSSAYRMDPEVPLVVPEINPQDAHDHRGIIANPNCSTIIMNMAVWPLHRINPIRRIIVSTYQAASGAGAAAMEELRTQTAEVLAKSGTREAGFVNRDSYHASRVPSSEPRPRVFPHPIAFNLFSHNTPIGPDGYNTEERKMIDETRKIFHTPDLAITATCIRVPVPRAHSESINLTFEQPITPDEVREVLAASPGIEIVDDVENNRFPMPIDATGKDACLVGRIRQDVSRTDGCGIELFVCGDQLRKGAALNAIQILELLICCVSKRG